MNIFKFDSPVMNFIGKVADMIILNILCLICSIPIITFGAAFTAKYYVSMKIVRGEEGTIIKPYFKAFAENFKQATIAWLIQLAVLALVVMDWFWVFNKGLSDVHTIYLIAIVVLSLMWIFVTITIFPFFARFEMTLLEAFKGSIIFSFLYFIKLFLIVALELMTFIACLWYGEWLPLILLFGTTTAFYFLNLTLIKGFKKLEAGVEKREAEEAEKKKEEEEKEGAKEDSEEEEEPLILRPDEHTVSGKIQAEKETIKALTFKEKLVFFKDYYLGKTIIVVVVAIFALWFLYDAFIGKKDIVYSGGLLYCEVTDEGRALLTHDLLNEMVPITVKQKKEVNLSDDLSLDFVEGEHEVVADASQDQMLASMIMIGSYDYFFIDAKLIDHYEQLDCYKDLTEYVELYNISEEDVYYSIPEDTDEEESDNGEKESEDAETAPGEDGTYINAIKLSDEICEKIGVSSRSGEGVYLTLVLNDKEDRDKVFMSYLFE